MVPDDNGQWHGRNAVLNHDLFWKNTRSLATGESIIANGRRAQALPWGLNVGVPGVPCLAARVPPVVQT